MCIVSLWSFFSSAPLCVYLRLFILLCHGVCYGVCVKFFFLSQIPELSVALVIVLEAKNMGFGTFLSHQQDLWGVGVELTALLTADWLHVTVGMTP